MPDEDIALKGGLSQNSLSGSLLKLQRKTPPQPF